MTSKKDWIEEIKEKVISKLEVRYNNISWDNVRKACDITISEVLKSVRDDIEKLKSQNKATYLKCQGCHTIERLDYTKKEYGDPRKNFQHKDDNGTNKDWCVGETMNMLQFDNAEIWTAQMVLEDLDRIFKEKTGEKK